MADQAALDAYRVQIRDDAWNSVVAILRAPEFDVGRAKIREDTWNSVLAILRAPEFDVANRLNNINNVVGGMPVSYVNNQPYTLAQMAAFIDNHVYAIHVQLLPELIAKIDALTAKLAEVTGNSLKEQR